MNRQFLVISTILVTSAVASAQQEATEKDASAEVVSSTEATPESPATASEGPSNAELGRRIDVVAAEMEKLQLGDVVPQVGESMYGMGPAASKVYAAQSGVTLGGYGELIYENQLDVEGDAVADFTRNILYIGHKFSDRFVLNTEIGIEHVKEIYLEFAYLDYLWRPELNLRAGMLLVPMGIINELHEPTTYLGALRPQTEKRIIPTTWRENGLGVFGEIGPLSYRAYLLNGFDASGFSAKGLRGGRQKGAEAMADDVAGVLRLDYEGIEGVLVGGSIYYGGADQNQADFSVNPLIYEAHLDVQYRGLSLRALYAGARVNGARDLSLALTADPEASPVGKTMQGWYAQAGYDLLSLVDTCDMAFIAFVRFEQVNTHATMPDDFDANPGVDQRYVTVGASFLPISQIVVKVEYAMVSDDADEETKHVNAALGFIY